MINFDFRSDVGAHVIRSFIKESEVIPTEMEIMIVRYWLYISFREQVFETRTLIY